MAKSINIKNDEAAALIAELTATGKGTTELILELLRREVQRRRKLMDVKKQRARVDAILTRARKKMPPRAPADGELIEYDENGLPV